MAVKINHSQFETPIRLKLGGTGLLPSRTAKRHLGHKPTTLKTHLRSGEDYTAVCIRVEHPKHLYNV